VNAREQRRRRALSDLVDTVALEEFERAHPDTHLAPVAIVIAAYKERDNIEAVTRAMPAELCGLATSVIVVIDGEEDGSAAIVRAAGQYAVIAPVNRGQGAALKLGYLVARRYGAEFIVTADADGQTDPHDLAVVLEPVVAGEADFVNGSRRLGRTESADAVRNTGVVVFATLISALTRTTVTDTANPVRAFRAATTADLVLDEPQFQASELLISAIMSGARYLERPVTMRARSAGASKKGGNLSYGANYAKVVARTFWREKKAGHRARPAATTAD
jgi:glycosyltransferase involved in cell wall biosynthesis